MAIFNPGDFGGIGNDGQVTINQVVAKLTATLDDDTNIEELDLSLGSDRDKVRIPFWVTFDASKSIGASLTLAIDGVLPIQRGTNASWIIRHRFTRPGVYGVMLTIVGGAQIESDYVEVTVLPAPPLGSDNLIIRATKIAALKKVPQQVQTEGDQV